MILQCTARSFKFIIIFFKEKYVTGVAKVWARIERVSHCYRLACVLVLPFREHPTETIRQAPAHGTLQALFLV